MGYPLIQAKSISYGGTRALSSVKYIVIHYTGVSNDTAKNEVSYFANGNTRSAGAHYFVDQTGAVYQSIPINRAAWSVGGFYTQANGAGSYYNKCTNYNSVSIEMCDNVNKDPSAKQTAAVKKLVAYIQKQCPNAKTIIRHWDVNGKSCPARMAGRTNSKWTKFKKAITGGSAPEPAKKATPAKKTTPKKSVATVAQEVIDGKWGTGDARKKKLKAAGYDYATVQAKVNALLAKKKPAKKKIAKKSNKQIAKEVVAGKWGNGVARRLKLKAAGYNYKEIQKEVNKLI